MRRGLGFRLGQGFIQARARDQARALVGTRARVRARARALVGTRARVRARAWAEAGYVVGPEVMGDFIKDSIHKVFGVLPTEKVLLEHADCVGEGRCVCIGTQEPDGFSLHQSLEDTPGVGRGKMEILESVSRLEVCF